ncbi:hypothetical protein V6Z12_A05G443100 [Gossypium hirsutum]
MRPVLVENAFITQQDPLLLYLLHLGCTNCP